MLVVQIEKPENLTLDRWFSEIRTWLDVNRCEPTAFMRAGRRLDRLIYRVSFPEPAMARTFAQHFAHYAASTRRATISEREAVASAVKDGKVPVTRVHEIVAE